MPYFSNYAKDDKTGSTGQGDQNSGIFHRGAGGAGADSSSTSGAGMLADSPGAASGASQKNAGNTGSQYQSLDSYLGANADSNFGNQVTSRVADQQAKGAADQQQAGTQFNQQVQGSNQVPTGAQISGAVANPITADPKQYQQWMNQTYQGPKSLSDSGSLQNQYWHSTKDAQTQTGQLAGNQNGQYSLLNSYFGGPAGSSSYSSNLGPTGQQGLDLSLAQHTAGYGQGVAALRQGAANLQQQGLQGQQALQNAASQQAGNVEQSANAARSAVGVDKQGQIIQGQGAGAIGNLEGTINQGVTDANAKQHAINSALQAGTLTPDQLKQYGIDPNEDTYGNINLGSYFTPGADLSAANTMTPDQLAKLKALQGLAGISPDTLGGTTLSAAGPATNFNSAGLQSDINTNKSNYNSAYNSAIANNNPDLATAYYGGATPPNGFTKTMSQVQDDYKDLQSKLGPDPRTWDGGPETATGLAMQRLLNNFDNKYNSKNTIGSSMAPKKR